MPGGLLHHWKSTNKRKAESGRTTCRRCAKCFKNKKTVQQKGKFESAAGRLLLVSALFHRYQSTSGRCSGSLRRTHCSWWPVTNVFSTRPAVYWHREECFSIHIFNAPLQKNNCGGGTMAHHVINRLWCWKGRSFDHLQILSKASFKWSINNAKWTFRHRTERLDPNSGWKMEPVGCT